MENFSIYKDIKERTNGDIYVGVVGPVRCGKSTFITSFMENLVLPNIKNRHAKERTIDELPQSADGLTIMTTQPKFIPSEAVKVNIANADMRVRMIDSVGYLIAGAMGHQEDDKPRLVKTPWTEKEIPFAEAAELGTNKIMTDHATIGIVMTSDGTINDIPRSSYVEAEEKVVAEMQKTGKPFIIVVNSTKPNSSTTQTLRAGLEAKYDVSTIALDVKKLDKEDIEEVFEKVLLEFPIRTLKVMLPEWMQALPYENDIISSVISEIKSFCDDISKIGQIDKNAVLFAENENFEPIGVDKISLGDGSATIKVLAKPQLFYKVLSQQCGEEIRDDFHLVSLIRELAYARREYKKIEEALAQVEQTGYGVVTPTAEEMVLDDPQIVKQGGRYGVKIRASAPSLHIMKVDVETELSPIVGSQAQSEEMVKFLANEFEENPETVWNTNMFGKSLYSMVNDGIKSKIVLMPVEAQQKMRKTLTRIVNEGKGGVICILL